MKNLLQTHTVSWAQSVRIALVSEGIDAVILDELSPGHMGFAGKVRVAVLRDDDLARAQAVVARLVPPRSEPPPSWRWQKRGLLLGGIGFLLFVTATTFSEPRIVVIGLMGTSVALLAAGGLLIALGPRADRKHP